MVDHTSITDEVGSILSTGITGQSSHSFDNAPMIYSTDVLTV